MKVKISSITIGENRRSVDPEKVQMLADSIKEVGLLSPVVISQDNVLVAGRHRLEAFKLLGRDEIEITLAEPNDKLRLRLAELDENLVRNEGTVLDRDNWIAERKRIYEELYPETKVGGDRKSEEFSNRKNSDLISFTEDTAKKVGKSRSTVTKSIARAERIPQNVQDKIAHTPIANKAVELDAIVKAVENTPELLDDAIEDVKSGSAVSFRQAISKRQKQAKIEVVKQEATQIETPELITVIHDDCMNYLPTLADNSIDLITLDPPYYGVTNDEWDNQWDTQADYLAWCKLWMVESLRILKPTGSFYIWGGIGEQSSMIIPQKLLLDELGFYFKDWITWKKSRGIGHKRGWLFAREELLWYVKDNSLFIWNEDEQYSEEPNQFKTGFGGHQVKSEFKRIPNVWVDIPEQLTNKGTLHYTPKPVTAMERIIKAHTSEGDTVLDFFAGSGTTGIAAKNLNRNCILVEKDEISVSETKVRVAA